MLYKLFSSLLVGLALCFCACQNDPPSHLKHDPNYTHAYVCPMDCEKGKMYGQLGDCPVCHMKLKQKEVRMEDLNRAADSAGHK